MSGDALPPAVAAVAATLPKGCWLESIGRRWRICVGATCHGSVTAEGAVTIGASLTPRVLRAWAAEHGHPTERTL